MEVGIVHRQDLSHFVPHRESLSVSPNGGAAIGRCERVTS
jgi:hypothetical protein